MKNPQWEVSIYIDGRLFPLKPSHNTEQAAHSSLPMLRAAFEEQYSDAKTILIHVNGTLTHRETARSSSFKLDPEVTHLIKLYKQFQLKCDLLFTNIKNIQHHVHCQEQALENGISIHILLNELTVAITKYTFKPVIKGKGKAELIDGNLNPNNMFNQEETSQ